MDRKAPARRSLSEGEEQGIRTLARLHDILYGKKRRTRGNGTGPALTPEEIERAKTL